MRKQCFSKLIDVAYNLGHHLATTLPPYYGMRAQQLNILLEVAKQCTRTPCVRFYILYFTKIHLFASPY